MTADVLRRFNRLELKYLLSLRQYRAISEEIRVHLKADEHVDEQGIYGISSLYFR